MKKVLLEWSWTASCCISTRDDGSLGMIEDSTLLSIRAIHNPNSISHIHVHMYPSTPIYAYVRTYICIYMNMTDVEMHARTDMAKFNQKKEAYLRIYPYLSHTDHPNTYNLP